MYDIRNLNIWKKEEKNTADLKGMRDLELGELNLSPRPYNCLKRANCNTVGDILDRIGEDGKGLRSIRNLGIRSEEEILENIEALKKEYHYRPDPPAGKSQRLVKPAKRTMERPIDDFYLSGKSRSRLKESGIYYVKDLYAENMQTEPGWYAVRELFEQILLQS